MNEWNILFIYFASLFVTCKRQNSRSDLAQFFLWDLTLITGNEQNLKNCLQNLKIHKKKILKNPQTHLLLFYNEQAWEPSAPKVTKVTPVNYPQLEQFDRETDIFLFM